MTEGKKLILPVTVDATGAKEGFQQIKDSARGMSQALGDEFKKAGQPLEELGPKSQKSAKEVEQTTTRIAEALKRQNLALESGGKQTAAYIEGFAKLKGANLDALQPLITQLKETEARTAAANARLVGVDTTLNRVGLSAKQTAAALRGVPAQFTDIVTSIASGQAPLTVLLQQGGQLKDMFGGVGNAARALGGYIVGLVNPFTALAAAAALVAVAYNQGSKEATEYQKALTLTGNAAGTTSAQLKALALDISAISGTQGNAAEAVTALASTGRVSADVLRQAGLAAVQYERQTGQALTKTAEQFASLRKEPLEALLKLNDGMNFLTDSVYRQVKGLDDQGRTAEAAAVAQRAYADSLISRAGEIERNLGAIESVWGKVKDAAKGAWDAMLNVGRPTTEIDKLSALREELARRQKQNRDLNIPDGAATRAIQTQIAVQEALIEGKKQDALATREQNEATLAGIGLSQQAVKYETDLEKQRRQVLAATTQYESAIKQAGLTEAQRLQLEKDYLQVVTGITAQKEKAARATRETGGDPFASERAAAQEWAKYYLEFSNAAEDAQAKVDGLTKSQAKLVLYLQSPAYANATEAMRELALQEAYVAIQKEQRLEQEKEFAKTTAETARSLEASAEAERQRVAESVRAATLAEEELANYGLLKSQVQQLQLAKLEEARESAALAGEDVSNIEKRIEAQKRLIAAQRGIEAKDEAKKQAEEYQQEWKRTSEFIENSLTDALLRGFESGKSFAKNFRDTLANMFKTLILKPIISFIVNPIAAGLSGVVTGALGSIGLGGASGGGLLGGIGNVGGLFNGIDVLNRGGIAGMGGLSNATGFGLGNLFGGGAGGSFASTVGGGLATDAMGATVAAGSSGATLGGGFAAIPGWGWALAGVALLAGLGKAFKGETRSGGQYGFAIDGVGQSFRRGTTQTGLADGAFFLEGPSGGDPNKSNALLGVNTAVGGINSRFAALGSNLRVTGFNAGYETSDKDRGGVFSGGTLTGGKAFGESGKGDNYAGTLYEKTSTQSPDSKAAWENFTTDLLQVSIQALQADTGLPAVIQKMVEGIDAESLSSEAATALLAEVDKTIAGVTSLNTAFSLLPFDALKTMSFDAAAGMIKLAGSIEALQANIATYYQNFFSPEEQKKQTALNIASSLNTAGGSFTQSQILSMSRDDFRALVTSYEQAAAAGDEAAQKMLVALYAAAGAFASIVPSAQEAAQALEQANQALEQQAQAAQDAALSALRRFIGVDREAAQSAQQVAQERVNELSSLFDTLKSAVSDIRGGVDGTSQAAGIQANKFIDDALKTARATGYLPDQSALSEAIGNARKSSEGLSQFQQDYQSLVLAGKLEEIQKLTGDQLTDSQKQLDAAETQVKQLDATLDYWEQQIALSRNIDGGIASTAEAIEKLSGLLAPKAVTAPKPSGPVGGGAVFGGGSAGPQGFEIDANGFRRYADGSGSMLSEGELDLWKRGLLGKVPFYDVGTNIVPKTSLAMVHEGEAIVPKAYNPFHPSYSGGDSAQLERVIERMNAEMSSMREELSSIKASTAQFADQFEQVSSGGAFVRTQEVPA